MQHTTGAGLSSDDGALGAGADAGFFERERLRLIQDIAKVSFFSPLRAVIAVLTRSQGMESTMDGANKTNRKIEESISVGREFHPISDLWSQFERIMHASGIPNLHPQTEPAPTAPATDPAPDTHADPQTDAHGLVFEAANRPTLPPGVAPGGGKIYA